MSQAPLPDLSGRTILQVIPDLAAGGAERTVIEVAEALTEAGAWALVVSLGGRLEPDLAAAGGELIKLNVATKNPFGVRGNASRLAHIITSREVDLIHARSRAPAWSALWAARRTHIPFVTTYHGAYSGKSSAKRLYNSVMARADRVIANSRWIAEHVQTVHGVPDDRLVTIARGVDLVAFDPAAVSADRISAMRGSWGLTPDDPRRILLLPGRLTSWKGQSAAIEAIARLDDELRQQVVLVLLGDAQGRDGYVDGLIQDVDMNAMEDRVVFAPHTADMPTAYGAADIVLTPSVRPEAFGRTTAEASAMAKPVIAYAHGGSLEIIKDGETGRLVPITPPHPAGFDVFDALSSAIAEMLTASPSTLRTMGEAGRAHVCAHFSKRGLQLATLRVYDQLLTPAS